MIPSRPTRRLETSFHKPPSGSYNAHLLWFKRGLFLSLAFSWLHCGSQCSTTWTSNSPPVRPLEAKDPAPSKGVSPLAKATRKTKTSRALATRCRSSSQESLSSENLSAEWNKKNRKRCVHGYPNQNLRFGSKMPSSLSHDVGSVSGPQSNCPLRLIMLSLIDMASALLWRWYANELAVNDSQQPGFASLLFVATIDLYGLSL